MMKCVRERKEKYVDGWYRRRNFFELSRSSFYGKVEYFRFSNTFLAQHVSLPITRDFYHKCQKCFFVRDICVHIKISHDHIEFSPWGLEREKQATGRLKLMRESKLKITCWRSLTSNLFALDYWSVFKFCNSPQIYSNFLWFQFHHFYRISFSILIFHSGQQ